MIAGIWIGLSILFAIAAIQVGKAVRSENDGCLLAIGNVVLTLLGGAIGFLVMVNHYPTFILSSMVGAMLLPSLAILAFTRRARKG